jgi:hypothetical protein
MIEDARSNVDNFGADFGGTEILLPVEDIIQKPIVNSYPRYVFLITDGDVANPDQIIATVYMASS